jgi:hypothetical protein
MKASLIFKVAFFYLFLPCLTSDLMGQKMVES